jgi:SAM-dependent methyltransferase
VLDVGCGRGLLLIGAARRLTTGNAIGLDHWLAGALTGNRPEAVIDNARIEGVLNRIELKQGDVRQLPFSDDSFDVVVSDFLLHEVTNRTEREQMLREIVRVLEPGGRLALLDFIFTGECVRVLQAIGTANAKRGRVGSFFSFWLGAVLNFGLVHIYQATGGKPSMNVRSNAQPAQGGFLAEPFAQADGGRDSGPSRMQGFLRGRRWCASRSADEVEEPSQ